MSDSDTDHESQDFYEMGQTWTEHEFNHEAEHEPPPPPPPEPVPEPMPEPMPLELYYSAAGPPSRAVLLLARALELPLELKHIDVFAGEHLDEDFVQMNPAHVVPFLVDGETGISESCAIMIYLVESYAKDDSLYPNDQRKRAIINERLFFNVGVLSPRILACYIPILQFGIDAPEESVGKANEAFEILDKYMDGHDWVAGDEMTIADYSYVGIISTAEGIGYDLSPYENVANWLVRCKETMVDYDELNQHNLDQLVEKFEENKSML